MAIIIKCSKSTFGLDMPIAESSKIMLDKRVKHNLNVNQRVQITPNKRKDE